MLNAVSAETRSTQTSGQTKKVTNLHDHDEELGHDVARDDFEGEDPGHPGPLKQPLGPLGDEGLRGEGHREEVD